MQTFQQIINSEADLEKFPANVISWDSAQTLVLIFFSKPCEQTEGIVKKLSDLFTNSIVTGCSTSGEILKDKIL